jgi:hypothetical protein
MALSSAPVNGGQHGDLHAGLGAIGWGCVFAGRLVARARVDFILLERLRNSAGVGKLSGRFVAAV